MFKRTKLFRKCQELRRKNATAPSSSILHWARAELQTAAAPQFDWDDNGRGRCKFKGYDLTARIVADDSPDTSYLGEFTNKPTADSVKRNPADVGRHEYRFYTPMNTLQQHRKDLQRMGYAKHEAYTLARKYVLQDMRRLASMGDDWNMYCVTVTASKRGIDLGSASVGGVDDYKSAQDTARDELAAEALADGARNMGELVRAETHKRRRAV